VRATSFFRGSSGGCLQQNAAGQSPIACELRLTRTVSLRCDRLPALRPSPAASNREGTCATEDPGTQEEDEALEGTQEGEEALEGTQEEEEALEGTQEEEEALEGTQEEEEALEGKTCTATSRRMMRPPSPPCGMPPPAAASSLRTCVLRTSLSSGSTRFPPECSLMTAARARCSLAMAS